MLPYYKWINLKNRICSTCKEEKPKEEFYGSFNICKECCASESARDYKGDKPAELDDRRTGRLYHWKRKEVFQAGEKAISGNDESIKAAPGG